MPIESTSRGGFRVHLLLKVEWIFAIKTINFFTLCSLLKRLNVLPYCSGSTADKDQMYYLYELLEIFCIEDKYKEVK